MRPTDALRALSRYAYPATLVSVASAVALGGSPTNPAGHLPTKRQAGMTSSSALQGSRGHLRAATSSLSITVGVAASSGGRAAPTAQGCAATVVLLVTVRYGPHEAWSRDTVMIYDPPPGVHVLTSRTAPTRRAHPDKASVRVPLPRPLHGRTQLAVKLSLRAGPVQGRDRLGRPSHAIGAHVGGRLRIMQGPHTLSSAVLRLLVPIRCATSQPGVHTRPTATATPTATPAPLPPATPTPSATATPLPLSTATPTPAAMQISATIQNVAFSPNPITIGLGSTVTWTNLDVVTHTVTADDGSWGSSTLGQGGTYSHVFTSPGTYTYRCAIHLYMMGTVVVTP
jgi:plastocyanin